MQAKIIHLKEKKSFMNFYDDILKLLEDSYRTTGGKYPAMEWLDEKPDYFDPNLEHKFREAYGKFLEWRLTQELDELFLLFLNDALVGSIALTLTFEGKSIGWIPEKCQNNQYGFIELFVVRSQYRGKGYGVKLLSVAMRRLKELKRKPLIVTFPNLKALNYYLKLGGVEKERFKGYVIVDLTSVMETLISR
ncbi:MAG: GNAT family N-acetyltransferase [Candidatus Asgardarchaeum californiense]|nr:MAG: GNAT family N-acetyltransferase [Candidatus Asgardarchaeum californiense]